MLIRHTVAYLPAQLLSPLAQFATALVLTFALGPADYGLTLLIFASQELAFLLCLSWWTTFSLRYGSRLGLDAGSAGMARLESAIVLLSCLAQVLATLLFIALTQPEVAASFYAAACAFTITRSHLGFLSERARREAAIGAYSMVQIAAPLGGLALTLALMQFGQPSPTAVLWVFALVQAAVGLAVARRLGLLVWPALRTETGAGLNADVLRAAARFGAPVALSNLLSWVGGNGIRFVVLHGAGAAALGLMSVGWGLATRLSGVAAMLVAAAAYPLAVKAMEAGDTEGAKRQISDNSALLLALLAPCTLGLWVLCQPFVELLVAQPYHAVTLQVLPWALLGASIRNLRMHGWDQLYLLCEAPRAMVVLDAVEAVVTVLGALIGLWWAGPDQAVLGAVVGTTVAAALLAVGDWFYLRWRFALHAPLGIYLRVLLAAAAMAAALAAAPHLGWPVRAQVGSLTLAAAAAALLYGAALAALFPGHSRRLAGWLRLRIAAK